MTKSNTYTQTVGLVLSAAPGYSETFFRNKIRGLQANGIKVILFVDYPSNDSNDLNCNIVVAPKFDGFINQFLNSIIAILKAVFMTPKASLIHLKLDKADGLSFKQRIINLTRNQYFLNHDLDWLHFGYGMLASNRENVAQTIKAKMGVSFRGYDLYLSPLKHINCYMRLFSKTIQYHVLSHKMKEKLMTQHISEDDIKVITPAINTSTFSNSQRKEIPNDTLQILCVSRLHWVKGIHYLLEALAFLKRDNIDFKLTIIGDGEEKERLIFAAHQYQILDQVTFTGKLPQSQVIDYYKSSNLYVQYSIQEGFGNAVLEAQAMGLLCVVSDADGLQQNILHDKTGWIVPKRNPKALAEKIVEVHRLSSEKKHAITEAAVHRVNTDFSLEVQNKLFLEFYKG